ncbi:type VI secretion system lipoprotein TssJ [Pantoea endophytica]|uniref:Type VI secretion system lipoprotein TssJ n=1 Tax=Pantoea endophytica TaxID=92488 RepID=A0ABX4SMJ0_9GAMM|nr:type VI secretion system lipoprotein TssJ [Pantoea endophytica]
MSVTTLIKFMMCSALLLLGGCGLQQKVTDGSVAAFDAIFYKQIKTLHLDFSARESLNSDSREHNPLSQPVMVRVFQLSERKAFDGAVYQQLTGDAADVLKAELLADRDVVLTPGGDVSLNMPMEKEAKFVAVVALFQQPDMAKNSWRLVLERNDLDPDKARVIELSSNSLRLITEAKP